MAVKLSPVWVAQQFFNSAGQPLSGGKITQYQAGTTTLQATFTDSTGSVQNANPIILDSAGRYSNQIWFTVGQTYKLVLSDSNNNTILTEDFLSGVNDTSSGVTSEWLVQSVPTFVNGTSFTVTGNQTPTFQVGRRVQATLNSGFAYSRIVTSAFTTLTTVTVVNDSTVLDNTLSSVAVGLLGTSDSSVPIGINQPVAFHAHRSTNQTSGTTVIFDTVDNQTGDNSYSNSTGLFTAPYTGWYFFTASGEVNSSVGLLAVTGLKITVNSVDVARSAISATNADSFQSVSTVAFMSATQTASIREAGGNTFAANYVFVSSFNNFSGYLIQRTA